jgi:hypothetical protein
MKIIAWALSCFCLAGAARAQDGRWITFKTGHDAWGSFEYQIDRASIHQEGPYKIFWTRIWIARKNQAMVFGRNEALIFLSQKFAVDCTQRRFASRFIDSNNPAEMKHKADLRTVRWVKLETIPAVGRAVCGDK